MKRPTVEGENYLKSQNLPSNLKEGDIVLIKTKEGLITYDYLGNIIPNNKKLNFVL